MRRSHVTIDLAAIRHNAAVLTGLLERTELWAVVKADGYGHGALDVARTVLDNGAAALCVATVGEALALRTELPDVRLVVLGPTRPEDVPVARDASLELDDARRATARGSADPPQARHRDGPVGPFRAARARPVRRRPDDALRHRRYRPALRPRAARAVPPGDRGVRRDLRAPRRQQRGGADAGRDTARRRALRNRSVRHRSLRRGSAPVRPETRTPLGVARRAGPPAGAGRVDRLRPSVRRRGGDLDRDRSRRLRGRVPARPDRDGAAGRRLALAAWSGRSRWTPSPSPSPARSRSARP